MCAILKLIGRTGRRRTSQMINMELSLMDALNIMRALAYASKHAKREDDHDEFTALYDRFDQALKKGEKKDDK